MKFFIDKIFNNETDKLVHLQFQKFSRGEFKNRAMIIAKKTGKGFNIKTTPEYANEFVRYLAEKLEDKITQVKGIIVSTKDLNDELEFQNKKQFMGVKKYIIDREMKGEEILKLCEKIPNSFIGLSFKTGDSELKIKPKAPKSAKPSSKKDNKKIDFCKLKIKDKDMVNSLLFDSELKNNWKKVEISHDFIIEEIIVSDELREEYSGDFGKIRKKALRKGRVVRRLKVDEGEEVVKEKEFKV